LSLVGISDLLGDAQERGYAVPNFWGTSMEMLLGQLRAAEELRAPLSLCYSAAQYPQLPMDIGVAMILAAAKQATVPVLTILDHGTDIDSCVKAIELGVSAVMYDGSGLSYKQNLENSREIAAIAHSRGAGIEAELGAVGGSAVDWSGENAPESYHTDPEKVEEFVGETRIDALAISFGNRHGLYRGETVLDFDLVRRIRERVSVPLVMHGGSDLTDEMYPRIVSRGISKVHFWSGPSKLAVDNLRQHLEAQRSEKVPTGYQDVFRWNADFFYSITRKYLRLLNAEGAFPSAKSFQRTSAIDRAPESG
jgi:fructose-bisphosphate aldolase class II